MISYETGINQIISQNISSLVIDGQNVYHYNTNGLTGEEKEKQQAGNMDFLLTFLNEIYDRPKPIVVFPKYKTYLKKSWVKSGWICFIADKRQSFDDYWIINYALQSGALIITNDGFSDWDNTNTKVITDYLIRFEIIGERFIPDQSIRKGNRRNFQSLIS